MLITDMKRVIEQVSQDKGIDFYVLVKTLEEALRSAVRKKFGNKIDIEIQYNEESGELEVFQFKNVVEEITDPDFEITLEEGRKLDPECEVGDSLGTKMDTTTFGRIAAQSAKQVIIQKLKAAERSVVYENFINRKGEIINGIVQRVSRNEIIVNLGQAEAVLPRREQIPNETYRRGDRIRAYILKVHDESRGPQIVLSRTHPEFLISLFKTEVPEITEGMISVISAAREAGSRGKIAVRSNDPDIDPVGACVGIKGNRVQSVVQELKGEKIDIIPWHIDPAKFVCNALAPAEISRVIIDEVNHTMEVVVPDDSLSIAIGKQGQNVRLASRLTGWHLDVISETRYNEGLQSGFQSLMNLSGVHEALANLLFEKGYFSTEDLSKAAAEDLVQEIGVTEDEARTLIEEAASDLESNEKPQDPTPGVSADAEPEAGEDEAADDADPNNSGE
ncbi:MAG: transcription termination/antitermination protein NusA [Desulfobacterales bacterium]|nr:transcription termination/antitermination protein NusA [Desulfobacterales bacterium]